MSWYTNPWVIGVIGSVPGGFLVNWITGLVLGKKENREYLQKVIGANREVVYAIRPGIPEEQIPSAEVVTALLSATARRYGVESSDLYTPSQIAEELTKEIMDSSFISSSQKNKYCAQLATLDLTVKKEPVEAVIDTSTRISAAKYRERLISSMSMLLGLLTVTMTVMVSLLELLRSKDIHPILNLRGDKNLQVFIPVLATVATMALTVMVLYLYRLVVQKREMERKIEEWKDEIWTRDPKSSRLLRARKRSSSD